MSIWALLYFVGIFVFIVSALYVWSFWSTRNDCPVRWTTTFRKRNDNTGEEYIATNYCHCRFKKGHVGDHETGWPHLRHPREDAEL